MRAVFDCNTLLQALASPQGPAGRCLQLAFEQQLDFFVSLPLIKELRDVTCRPRVIRKLRLTEDRVEKFFAAIERVGTLVDNVPEVFAFDRDPADARYVDLAYASGSAYIVSRDKDLLELMKSSDSVAQDFRSRFPDLQIVDPVYLLALLDVGQT
jgi:putative PIN family toxin of toxin-antitoxin system